MTALSKTRLYRIYTGMKSRCYNTNDQHYRWYGQKGVTICDQWLGEHGVQNFIAWALDNAYEDHLTIDRVDPAGPYSPENCRWITQSLNSSLASTKSVKCTIESVMDISTKIKLAVTYAKISEAELARRICTSSQALGQRMKTGKFSSADLEKIAAALGAEYSCSFTFSDGTKI